VADGAEGVGQSPWESEEGPPALFFDKRKPSSSWVHGCRSGPLIDVGRLQRFGSDRRPKKGLEIRLDAGLIGWGSESASGMPAGALCL
jgi:hypothetical protein